MANDDDFERRFPLRRPPPEAEPAPRPSPSASGGWTAKSQARIKDLLDTLELSDGLPPPGAKAPAPPKRDRSAQVHEPRWTPPPPPPRRA